MKTAIVIPNWNGRDSIGSTLQSLLKQSVKPYIIVVDNGSADGSAEYIKKTFPDIKLIVHNKNLGFAGGVNAGIEFALDQSYEFVGLLNNDATVHKDWLKNLLGSMSDKNTGIVTSKIVDSNNEHFDSTGDQYTSWGLPYPRGRGETVSDKYNKDTDVFGASGGASLYRAEMLKSIGLFDEDFFAYYEDVDISFRAQLAGWKVAYQPNAVAYHQIGATSSKIKGFTTYQTIKNLPFVFWKNIPLKLMPKVAPRLFLAYWSFVFSALARGQITPVVKGLFMTTLLLPKKLVQRHKIQSKRKVSADYIWSIMTHDLPPNAHRLRKVRSILFR